jgi:hypothetical protein
MKNLPTEAGSVIAYSHYYDGPNYGAATLSYDTRYKKYENGQYIYQPDPDFPAGYEEGEEAEMVPVVEYEGPMWFLTGFTKTLTPAEAEKRWAIPDSLREHYPEDANFYPILLRDGGPRGQKGDWRPHTIAYALTRSQAEIIRQGLEEFVDPSEERAAIIAELLKRLDLSAY